MTADALVTLLRAAAAAALADVIRKGLPVDSLEGEVSRWRIGQAIERGARALYPDEVPA